MTLHREKWQSPLTVGASPGWTCPTCSKATLNPHWKGILAQETRSSRNAKASEDWEPDWETKRFTLLLRCSAPECGEVVVVAGSTRLVDTHVEESGMGVYDEFYRPEYVEPSPHLIDIPKATSNHLKEVLEQAFRLYWVDAAACMARLRAFTEDLVTALGVAVATRVPPKPQMSGGKKPRGRLRPLSLDARLQKLAKRRPGVAEQLMAVKWLGNAGAHAGKPPTTTDALDAMEILEHVLARVYAPRGTLHLVRKVNKKKGPVSKKRRTTRRKRPSLRNPGR